ncbi:MAG TPA: peptidylprolyl isomerase [Thermoanaerobaculia bacterium]|nr:peptidylprolyl isomerase [Thermoanaerobaculia bacterium]
MPLSLALLTSLLAVVAAPAAANAAAKPQPRVTLETTKGKIVIELYPAKAPKTVANFLQYVRAGHYDGTIFHRVIPGFMIQGGGYDAEGKERPTRPPVPNEADNGLTNDRGTVAMARTSDPDSASAQFFINVVDNGSLNHKSKTAQGWGYTVFGRVVEGMDVADVIVAVPKGRASLGTDQPVESVIIKKATASPK